MKPLTAENQILQDIFNATYGTTDWARIFCNDGRIIECAADFWTYASVGDDEDVPALCVEMRNGSRYCITGDEIDHFEIIAD